MSLPISIDKCGNYIMNATSKVASFHSFAIVFHEAGAAERACWNIVRIFVGGIFNLTIENSDE